MPLFLVIDYFPRLLNIGGFPGIGFITQSSARMLRQQQQLHTPPISFAENILLFNDLKLTFY
jgi:hypothetical protein